MRITIQHTEGCPNVEPAESRIREALRKLDLDAAIDHELIRDEAHARRSGFVGSPTILIEGRDPFGSPSAPPALACRIYRSDGGADGAPTMEQIVEALQDGRTRRLTTSDLEAIANVISTNPVFVGPDAELVVSAYNLLANGEPVSIEALAKRLGRQAEGVQAIIERCNVEFDGHEIVGFGGLTTRPTSHRFFVRGHELYTWCAWDPLFIAPILGDEARVESTCPVTGERITLTIGKAGVTQISPASAVLSMRIPDECSTTDIRAGFCNDVLLVASSGAAREWTAGRADTFVIELVDAFALGQMVVQQRAAARHRHRNSKGPTSPSS